MDPSREAGVLGDKLDAAWARRVAAAQDWNARLARGEIKPSVTLRAKWCFQAVRQGKGKGWSGYGERRRELEARWREKDGVREASLAWALNDTIGRSFWLGGVFKVGVYRGCGYGHGLLMNCAGIWRHCPAYGSTSSQGTVHWFLFRLPQF